MERCFVCAAVSTSASARQQVDSDRDDDGQDTVCVQCSLQTVTGQTGDGGERGE